jgi:predicted MFS family arabinose efflux permease
VLGPYGALLKTPGAAPFSGAGFVGRLPISMTGLGIVLLETSKGVSYAVAGLIAACFAVAAAVGGPIVSGLVDRLGQSRVLPWAVAAHSVFMVALMVALDRSASLWVVVPLAAGAGIALPSVGSMVRARWAWVLARDRIHVAYAWESILDELIFIIGPPLATVLALNVDPAAALVACLILVLAGVAWLIPQHRTEPEPHRRGRTAGRAAIRQSGMFAVFLTFVFVGGVFGSFEVVTVGFAAQRSVPQLTGVLLALYAFGSLLAGFTYGAMPSPRFHGRRMNLMLIGMAVVTSGLPLAGTAALLAPLAFLAGLAVAPVLISGTALVERIVLSSQLTEGITWTITGLALGVAVSAPVAGAVIDTRGAGTAYLVTSGCAVIACATAWASSRTVHRAEVEALAAITDKAVGKPRHTHGA